MTNNTALLQQSKEAEVQTDHSVAAKGKSEPRIAAEGTCPARLVGYVELGTHPQPDYQGQSKPPAIEVQLTFECYGKSNVDEIEVDGNKKEVGRIIRMLPTTLKIHERAKFYKLFKDMDYGRGLDHMSRMLNDVFRLKISHSKSKAGTKYAKIDAVLPPIVEITDPDTGDVTGTQDITDKVMPATCDLQLFVLERPTIEMWNSIEIKGTYTKKVKDEATGDESEEEVSKNFIQEKIKSGLDWDGSPMQALLLNLDSPEPETKAETVVKDETPAHSDAAEEIPEGPHRAPTVIAEDMLAELGLE